MQYADLVERNGFYLTLLDILLLCIHRDKGIMIGYIVEVGEEVKREEVKLISLKHVLEEMTTSVFVDIPDPDLGSENTWVFIACTADFKPASVEADFLRLNHFIPAWHKDQLKAEFDWVRCCEQESLLNQLAANAQATMDLMNKDLNDDEDVVLSSLLDEGSHLKNQQRALDLICNAGLVPKFVLADGNCALWSVLALQHGRSEVEALGDPDTAQLRQVTRRHFPYKMI